MHSATSAKASSLISYSSFYILLCRMLFSSLPRTDLLYTYLRKLHKIIIDPLKAGLLPSFMVGLAGAGAGWVLWMVVVW